MIAQDFINSPAWNKATAEQLIYWDEIFTRYKPASIIKFVFTGGLIGSEFETISAQKLYFALEMTISCSSPVTSTSPYVRLKDPAGADLFYLKNTDILFDASDTTQYFSANNQILKNIAFGGLTDSLYDFIHFIGYKLVI